MSDINQVAMSRLLQAMVCPSIGINSSSLNNTTDTLSNTSNDFNSIFSNMLGGIGSSNTSGLNSLSGINNSYSELGTLATLLAVVNLTKIANQSSNENVTSSQNSTVDKVDNAEKTKQVNTSSKSSKMDKAIALLKEQVGKDYVWGATGPNSFDCSGLVQYIYKKALDKNLPRVSYEQSKCGKEVSKSNLQVGDLIFFDTMNKGSVSHVGIYIGDNQFIHASNPTDGVKKSTLSGYYDKTFVCARRIV